MGVFYEKNEKLVSKEEIKFEGKDKEEQLESLLINHPEIFPVNEISEAEIWIPLARQLSISGHGRLDILATDSDGNFYIVECKINDNQDLKYIRGQITDYAAGLWAERGSWDKFQKNINENSISGKDLNEILESTVDKDAIQDVKDNMKQSFENGKYFLVYAVDKITHPLRQKVEWHNSIDQSHQYPSFSLEVKRYKSDDKSEFIVTQNYPYDLEELKLRKQRTENRNLNTEDNWNEKFKNTKLKDEQRNKIVDFTEKLKKLVVDDKGEMDYGTGKNMPVMMPKFSSTNLRSPIKLLANGRLTMQFGLVRGVYPVEADEFQKRIFEINGLKKSIVDSGHSFSSPFEIDTWIPHKDRILEILKEVFVNK